MLLGSQSIAFGRIGRAFETACALHPAAFVTSFTKLGTWSKLGHVSLFLICLLASTWSGAVTLERVGKDVFVSGTVMASDDRWVLPAFEQAPIERLILVNSPGGDLAASMRIARWLTQQDVTTLAVGPCLSACSLIFMAGQQRQYASGFEPRMTVVGIHGPSMARSGKLVPERALEMLAFYKERMGDKFDPQLMDMALFQMQDATGFVLIREFTRNRPYDRITLHCPTGQTPRDQCAEFPGKDALSLGVVTARETVVVALPAAMRPVL